MALIGTLAVGLTFVAARRFFDRRVGLVAALLMAVAFLPVFYSHVALNNVPATAAALGSLIGTAGILRRGATRDYVLAGAFVGVAAATKYLDGIVVVPMLTATLLAPRGPGALPLRRALAIGLGAALAAFVDLQPLRADQARAFPRQPRRPGRRGREAQVRPGPRRRARLLPGDLHLGAGLDAGARRDWRRGPARPRRTAAGRWC